MPETYNKSTDSEHKVTMTSSIIAAVWSCGRAVGGEQAHFEVLTALVGDGSKITVTGKSQNGAKLGKVKDVVRRNKFRGALDIPEDVEIGDQAWFEVELSGVGLSTKSNSIPLIPPVKVTNQKWSLEKVTRGELVTMTADVTGLPPGSELDVVIYQYSDEGIHDRLVTLRTVLSDNKIHVDWEFAFPEPLDTIPTQAELEPYGKSYQAPRFFFTIKVDNAEYGKESPSAFLEFEDTVQLQILDRHGSPLSGESVSVSLADGSTVDVTPDDNGLAALERIPPGPYRYDLPRREDEDEDSSSGSDSQRDSEADETQDDNGGDDSGTQHSRAGTQDERDEEDDNSSTQSDDDSGTQRDEDSTGSQQPAHEDDDSARDRNTQQPSPTDGSQREDSDSDSQTQRR